MCPLGMGVWIGGGGVELSRSSSLSPSAAACTWGWDGRTAAGQAGPSWACPFQELRPVALAPQGSRAVAPEWNRYAAAGGQGPASCAHASRVGRVTQQLPSAQRWVWQVKSVLPGQFGSGDSGRVWL